MGRIENSRLLFSLNLLVYTAGHLDKSDHVNMHARYPVEAVHEPIIHPKRHHGNEIVPLEKVNACSFIISLSTVRISILLSA